MVESLRDRLWSAVLDANTTQCWVRDAAGYDQATETVDAVLEAIEQAGYRVVKEDRWERVAGDAERWRKFAVTGLTPDGCDFTTVQPGDLEGGRG